MDQPSWSEFRAQLSREEGQSGALNDAPKWAIEPAATLPLSGSQAIVHGLWRREEVLLLGGHAKSWKSWAQMDLMYCISNGFSWLSWDRVSQGKVLHIDLELFRDEIAKRYQAIQQAYGEGNIDNIDVVSLRGRNFSLADFSSLADHITTGTYLAISFDPTYRLLGGQGMSESDSGVIIDLMNRSLAIAARLNTGIDLLQHFSKGNQTAKRDLDAFSGSGVWGRAPDSCLTFREHEDERCFTVSANLRHWPQIEPFVVQFDYPRFLIQQTKDPENLKIFKPNGRPRSFSLESLCNLIESDENISYSNFFRRCEAAGVKSETTFKRRLKEAKDKGWLALSPLNNSYFLTSNYVSKFRDNGQKDH